MTLQQSELITIRQHFDDRRWEKEKMIMENANDILVSIFALMAISSIPIFMFMLIDFWLDGIFSTYIVRRLQKWMEY